MDDSWEWWEELCYKKHECLPELSEDLYFYMIKKNKILEELIERFSLEMEI